MFCVHWDMPFLVFIDERKFTLHIGYGRQRCRKKKENRPTHKAMVFLASQQRLRKRPY